MESPGREADHADLLRAGEDLDFILCSRKELYLFAGAEIAADCVASAAMIPTQPWRHKMPLSLILPEVSFLGF